jgi:hypothetical protein
MARAIAVIYEGREVRFAPRVVTRAKLYGERKRLVLDEQGQPTSPGWLTTDGSLLLTQGARAELYLDERDEVVDRKSLVAVDAAGVELPRVASTLDVPQVLIGPVPPARVLGCTTTSVYLLEPETPSTPGMIDPELAARLEAGEIFETTFAYAAGFEASVMFLIANEEGIFGLVGTPTPIPFLRKDAPVALDADADADGDADEDLDFSMF